MALRPPLRPPRWPLSALLTLIPAPPPAAPSPCHLPAGEEGSVGSGGWTATVYRRALVGQRTIAAVKQQCTPPGPAPGPLLAEQPPQNTALKACSRNNTMRTDH